ncbi:MAG: CoA transferase [Acidimicrobiia bacterium]
MRVLEVATLYSAPQIGALLGDLGADVVKVEPPGGDPMRHMGQQRDGRAVAWELVARNKRSVVLDLDQTHGGSEADRATFDALVRAADVLVENLTPAVRTRWECTYEQLAARNPRLVVVSVSCYGLTGPYADRPGAGTLAEAFAGLTHMTGEPDGPPMLSSVAIGDTVTAFWGVIGALAACWGRDAGRSSDAEPRGRLVDVSMVEPMLHVMAGTIAGWDREGAPPIRSGSRVPGGVPRNVYRTADEQYVAVSGTTDAQVARVLGILGRADAASRDRFGTAAARRTSGDELDALVAAWVGARPRDAVVAAFVEARVAISPVNDARDVLGDPQVRARGAVVEPGPAPDLDAHHDEVLADWSAGSGSAGSGSAGSGTETDPRE